MTIRVERAVTHDPAYRNLGILTGWIAVLYLEVEPHTGVELEVQRSAGPYCLQSQSAVGL